MSDTSTSKTSDPEEPSAESLAELPEIDAAKHRRVPGRGHHVHLRGGPLVAVDPDLWPYFGSTEAVNSALRGLVEVLRHMQRASS
jgi:hypothetical protein